MNGESCERKQSQGKLWKEAITGKAVKGSNHRESCERKQSQGKLWKEAITTYFKITTLQVPGGTEECYNTSKSRLLSPSQDSNQKLPKTQVRSTTAWANQLRGKDFLVNHRYRVQQKYTAIWQNSSEWNCWRREFVLERSSSETQSISVAMKHWSVEHRAFAVETYLTLPRGGI
jgi:hypothetical protein